MTQRTRLLLLVAAVLVVLVALRYLVWTDTGVVQPSPPAERASSTVEIRQETGDFLPGFESFDAIAARPLFRSDRRPAPVEVVQAPVLTPQTATQIGEPEFTVIGTVTGPEGGVATIRTEGETRRAYVGDTIEGWRIDSISRSSIEVSNSGNAYRLPIGEREP
ncbi:hypothetical protein [Hyphobacterium sp.]|uniref:hypothetical protein n=1 Tax=Hyphobacterium sp. TaxID=2004662 RepID=UPI003BA97C61